MLTREEWLAKCAKFRSLISKSKSNASSVSWKFKQVNTMIKTLKAIENKRDELSDAYEIFEFKDSVGYESDEMFWMVVDAYENAMEMLDEEFNSMARTLAYRMMKEREANMEGTSTVLVEKPSDKYCCDGCGIEYTEYDNEDWRLFHNCLWCAECYDEL